MKFLIDFQKIKTYIEQGEGTDSTDIFKRRN